MAPRSAGVLPYRVGHAGLEVMLVHPGGPFWARRDLGAWSLPKGELEPGEDPRDAALRECREELGLDLDGPRLVDLGEIKQRGGKLVRAWAAECALDPSAVTSNTFSLEWPPRSGQVREFPEIDRAQWFSVSEARRRMLEAQVPLLDRLLERLEAA
ncbi:MAG: NUDIX domain-containing protein [Actinobacteria bacterium]|nr:MAG: NUDIX domain-containing protein [Actinomycetota bacterium]